MARVSRPLQLTNPCRCVAKTVMYFRDEEAGCTCARCGRRLAPAIGTLVQLASPVQPGFDELVDLMSVA